MDSPRKNLDADSKIEMNSKMKPHLTLLLNILCLSLMKKNKDKWETIQLIVVVMVTRISREKRFDSTL